MSGLIQFETLMNAQLESKGCRSNLLILRSSIPLSIAFSSELINMFLEY